MVSFISRTMKALIKCAHHQAEKGKWKKVEEAFKQFSNLVLNLFS